MSAAKGPPTFPFMLAAPSARQVMGMDRARGINSREGQEIQAIECA
jgi:hypothetical protein